MAPIQTGGATPESRSDSVAAASAQYAAMLVALGSSVGGPLRFPVGVPLLLAGLLCASAAMWRLETPRPSSSRGRVAMVILLLGAMGAVGLLAPRGPGPGWYLLLRRAYFVAGLFTVGVWLRRPGREPRTMIRVMAGWALLVHVLGVIAVPDPFIDTWGWTQACLRALADGTHPYTVGAGDIAHGWYWNGRTAASYPYMPLTLVAFLPSYLLLGDYRYQTALLFPATLWLLRRVSRRLGLDRDTITASSLILLLLPRQFESTVSGYIEPMMIFTVAAFAALATAQPGGLGQATAFMLLPALKQYCVAPAVLFATVRQRTSTVTLAGAVALAWLGALPFLSWDLGSTLTGIAIQTTTLTEPRQDAASLVAMLSVLDVGHASRWLSVSMQAMAGLIAYWNIRHAGTGGLLLGSAISLLATFLAGWQSFPNYFLFISVMLVVASLLLRAPRSSATF